jgi:hypothetical protein
MSLREREEERERACPCEFIHYAHWRRCEKVPAKALMLVPSSVEKVPARALTLVPISSLCKGLSPPPARRWIEVESKREREKRGKETREGRETDREGERERKRERERTQSRGAN